MTWLLWIKFCSIAVVAILVADVLVALLLGVISVLEERSALRRAGVLQCRDAYFAEPGAPMARRMTRREVRRKLRELRQQKKDVDAGATSGVY